MIALEQAVALLTKQLPPQTQSELVPLSDAVGRITACTLKAPLAVPNFARSAMDGYAVYAVDTATASREQPVTLTVLGTIFAGDALNFEAQVGTAVRIMTGAAVPVGYDAVVKQETTDYGQDQVKLYRPVKPGKNYVPVGEDVTHGQTIMAQDTYLNSDSIGILASLGFTTVPVWRRLRVGLIATGNELVRPGQPLAANQIYNSTTYSLAAYIERTGGQIVVQTICRDDSAALTALLTKYSEQVDLFITTGGVSVGEKDFIPATLAAAGGQELFHFVNLKPGTPLYAAVWQQRPLLALSGNPFAAMVNFHLFYWALLTRFQRNDHFQLKQQRVRLVAGEMPASTMRRFVRAERTDNGVIIAPIGHFSAVLHNMVTNNCLVEQAPGQKLVAGDQVTIYVWPN
ncbi:molybdopterin molybdotransferase MoeA [Loigolactobacillus jiayinensis]|uniref:Molybdopterin molybdenumtransferase n=1 Tax=Loigolactobacillus jiayinensis TaxID=2486016 RepID=A0ABW1RJ32_9LACO|nr:gephyrin-like molybdotransferase Glp [Loigolactobacillus jiayinensis]